MSRFLFLFVFLVSCSSFDKVSRTPSNVEDTFLASTTFKRISVDKINDFEDGKSFTVAEINDLDGDKGFKMGSPGNEKDRDDDEDQVAVSISKDYEIKSFTVAEINDLDGDKGFKMGSPGNEKDRDDDEDQVAVSISKDYEIMTKEVTQRQWFEVTGKNPSRFKTEDDCDNHMRIGDVEMCLDNPLERVTWNEIDELFVKKLNIAKGLTGCDGTPKSQRGCLRLPTEAEWENAARCGTTTAYSFGNDPAVLASYGIYRSNSGRKTHKVGSLRANPCDLYDVHGNVWEWVQDRYKRKLLGRTDPLQTSGLHRVIRGGGWYYGAKYLRSADRNYDSPDSRYSNIGFRLVRTL